MNVNLNSDLIRLAQLQDVEARLVKWDPPFEQSMGPKGRKFLLNSVRDEMRSRFSAVADASAYEALKGLKVGDKVRIALASDVGIPDADRRVHTISRIDGFHVYLNGTESRADADYLELVESVSRETQEAAHDG